MKPYLLRNVPDDLWDAIRHLAIDKGRSIRELITEALRRLLKEEGK
jgi:plasmid stability protein